MLPHFVPRTDSSTGVLPCVGQHHLFDDPADAQTAATLCARCPLRTACDTWATTHREWGTWAGRTDQDRGTPRHADHHPPRPVQPGPNCGTDLQQRRHRARGEHCTTCTTAHDQRVRAEREQHLAGLHARPDGPTRDGYRMHRELGQEPCDRCLAVHRAETGRSWYRLQRRLAVATAA